MTKSWDIIFWTTQKAVNYVPSSWSNQDLTAYKWPVRTSRPGQISIKELIDNCEDLAKDFKYFPAVFKKRVANLEDAEKYTAKGEKESDLDTDEVASEHDSTATRASKRSFNYFEEYSDDEDNTPTNSWKRHRPQFTPLSGIYYIQ